MSDGLRRKVSRLRSPEETNWGALSNRSAETIAEIAALVAAGLTYEEIAQLHGRSVAWCASRMAQLRAEIVEVSARDESRTQ
jgi:DNA-directed RNA polymerase specialized sigma24 family protein